jgi:hypothetical protein
MVDRILLECLKFSVKPDLILFNSAIDAYIRYGHISMVTFKSSDSTELRDSNEVSI